MAWQGSSTRFPPPNERLSINPDLAEARCVKAHIFEEQGKQAEAIAEIETALRLDPESWEVNREAARLISGRAEFADAIPLLRKSGGSHGTDWHNPPMLMTCYRSTGDDRELQKIARITIERAEKAIAKDPTNAQALAAGASALALARRG